MLRLLITSSVMICLIGLESAGVNGFPSIQQQQQQQHESMPNSRSDVESQFSMRPYYDLHQPPANLPYDDVVPDTEIALQNPEIATLQQLQSKIYSAPLQLKEELLASIIPKLLRSSEEKIANQLRNYNTNRGADSIPKMKEGTLSHMMMQAVAKTALLSPQEYEHYDQATNMESMEGQKSYAEKRSGIDAILTNRVASLMRYNLYKMRNSLLANYQRRQYEV